MPLLSVVATGVPKVPPAPPSLKATLTPGFGAPPLRFEANTVSAVGRTLPVPPVWLFPAVGVRPSLGARYQGIVVASVFKKVSSGTATFICPKAEEGWVPSAEKSAQFQTVPSLRPSMPFDQ